MVSEMKKGPAGDDMIENLNEEFDTFEAWVVDHWRLIAAVSVGIVVLVAAVGTGLLIQKHFAKKTAEQFALADSMDKLVQALKDHPGSSFAPDARMRLATLQMEKKSYAEAIANFKEVSKDQSASDSLRNRAALNSAYAQELQGKLDEALVEFNILGHGVVPENVRKEANYGAGRLYFGKREYVKAKKCFKDAHTVSPRSMGEAFWASQAKSMLDRVESIAPSSSEPALPASVPAPKASI